MIEIISAGAQTTVQDGGRVGYEHLGISAGGAVDFAAYTFANRMVGNEPNIGALEAVLKGPVFRALDSMVMGTAGIAHPTVDGIEVGAWSRLEVEAGAVVNCEGLERARGYVAFGGGLEGDVVLGSRSTNIECGFGGWEGRSLRVGDRIPVGPRDARVTDEVAVPPWVLRSVESLIVLGFVPGQSMDEFGSAAFAGFANSEYRVSHQSNHVGVRLEGPPVAAMSRGNRISEPMPIGGVQITPAGQAVVLLAARGTIGGYPVIATVITPDLWTLGQAIPGDMVRFQEITFDEAREITLRAYRELGL
jgi:biotin-dependent carboxylase-like uncharacterized protein